MKDRIEFEVSALDDLPKHRLNFGARRINSCIPQVSISSDALSAIRAKYFSGIDCVIFPGDGSAALTAVERN